MDVTFYAGWQVAHRECLRRSSLERKPSGIYFFRTIENGGIIQMRILHAGSELTPFARPGGLGDVLERLPAALAERGHEVSVVGSCYRGLREDPRLKARDTGVRLHVSVGSKSHEVEVW